MSERGRPRYTPTEADRNTVRSMAASGFRHEVIAACLGERGLDDKTMRRHFRKELDLAAHKANASVANRVYNQATTSENPAWALFWLKCRAGWIDRAGLELTGAGGRPLIGDLTRDRVAMEAAMSDLPVEMRRKFARKLLESDNGIPE